MYTILSILDYLDRDVINIRLIDQLGSGLIEVIT